LNLVTSVMPEQRTSWWDYLCERSRSREAGTDGVAWPRAATTATVSMPVVGTPFADPDVSAPGRSAGEAARPHAA